MAVGLFLVVYGAVTGNETFMIVGGGIAGVPVAGYSIARGIAKRPPPPPANPES